MKLLGRRKPDYQLIAKIEAELGLDDATLERQAEQRRRDREWKEKGGVVELRPGASPLAALAHKQAVESALFQLQPGATWFVDDPQAIRAYQPGYASATAAANYVQVFRNAESMDDPSARARRAGIELPTGVRV